MIITNAFVESQVKLKEIIDLQKVDLDKVKAACNVKNIRLGSINRKLEVIDPALINKSRYGNVSIIKKIALIVFYNLNALYHKYFGSLESDIMVYSKLKGGIAKFEAEITKRSEVITILESVYKSMTDVADPSSLSEDVEGDADDQSQTGIINSLVSLGWKVGAFVFSKFDNPTNVPQEINNAKDPAIQSIAVEQNKQAPLKMFSEEITGQLVDVFDLTQEDATYFSEHFFPKVERFSLNQELIQTGKMIYEITFTSQSKLESLFENNSIAFVVEKDLKLTLDTISKEFIFEDNKFIAKNSIGACYLKSMKIKDNTIVLEGVPQSLVSYFGNKVMTLSFEEFKEVFNEKEFTCLSD